MTLLRTKIKIYLANIALIAISVFICIFILDLVLHFTSFRHLLKREIYPKDYFTQDDQLGYVIAKNVATTTHYFADGSYPIWSNEFGCFDRSFADFDKYIYLTGDSFAWGFAPYQDKWGNKIEELTNIRVAKCGIGGYGTKQEMLKTKRDLSNLPRPELIVLGYLAGNDIEDDKNFPNYTVYKGYLVNNLDKSPNTKEQAYKIYDNLFTYCSANPTNYFVSRIKCWFNNNSIVYNLLKDNSRVLALKILPQSLLVKLGLIVNVENKKAFEVDEINLSSNLLNILNFAVLAKDYGSDFLVVLIPGDNEKQKQFLEAMNIRYIDLDFEFAKYDKNYKKNLYWSKDGHWNERGNHLAGYIVSKYILENNLINNQKDASQKLENIDSLIHKEFLFGEAK